MNCKKCGKELKEGAKFCSECGEPINSETSKRNSKLTLVIIGTIVIFAIIIGYLIMNKMSKERENTNTNINMQNTIINTNENNKNTNIPSSNKGTNIQSNNVNTNAQNKNTSTSAQNNITSTNSQSSSTSLQTNTKPKEIKTKKVYSAVPLNAAKVLSVDSNSGHVSFTRFCQYCGNEWGKSSFYISRSETIEYACGYCTKCKKYVGNVKIQCTVVETVVK